MILSLRSYNHEKELHGVLSLIASAFAFSLMTVCVKKLEGRIPIAELIVVRAIVSLVITRFMLRKAGISPWGKNRKLLFIRGLLGTGALFCIFQSLAFLPLSTATIIQYTYPTFTALFAFLFLNEKLRKRILLSVILGWIGIRLVVIPANFNGKAMAIPLFAICIALTGAILTAIAYVLVRKLSQSEHKLVIIYYFPLVSIPTSLPFLTNNFVIPNGIEWLWLLGIGLFTQLGQIYITKGLSFLPAGHASSINYSQVIFSTIWGVILFSEQLTPYIFLGSLCVLAATLISLSAKGELDLKRS